MKRQLLLVLLLVAILLPISGCFSGTGFEKKTTLMPDNVGISIGQQHYSSDASKWGFTVNAGWNLE